MKFAFRLFFVAASCGLLSTACSSDEPSGTSDPLGLEAPAEGEGVQIRMLSTLEASREVERCMFYVVPPEGLWVQRQEVKFTGGSHHVLLYRTPYTAVPDQDLFEEAVDTSGVFDCGEHGPTAHWSIDGVVGGSQAGDGPPIVAGLPEDTALSLPGGTVLLMNTHYLNASDAPIETEARINLYTVAEEKVKQEAGILFFYNPFIRVPAEGEATAREVCPVRKDITLVNAQSHMHKRGVGFSALLRDAEGAEVSELYSGTEWEHVPMSTMDPALTIEAGHSIDFRCEYRNREERVVTQGLTTEDEMCMFVGLYYPRDRQTELCGLNDDWSGAFMGARWVGNGSASGGETLACLTAAASATEDGGDSFYGCVVDSCPAIATEMSDVARCLATDGYGACADAACIQTACGEAFQALAVASCE